MNQPDHTWFPPELYRTLFDQTADPIFVLDISGKFVEMNQAACKHIGYSRDELLQMSPANFNAPESLDKIPLRTEQIKRDGYGFFEATHIHRNGTHIPVEMHIRTVQINDTTFFINVCREIRERKQREIEFHAMVQAASDSFWIVNPDNARFLEVNDTFCKTTGYSRDELLSMHPFDVEAAESPDETEAHIKTVMETGHDLFETRHRHKDGHLIDVEVSVSYADIQGGIFYVFSRDISERKQTDIALNNSERELRNIFNTLQEAYYRTDIEGRVMKVSPSAGKLMACEPDELLGKEIAQYYVHESGREHFLQALHEGHGSVSNYEAEIRRSDGEIIWVSTNAHYFRDKFGNVTGVEGTIRDITQIKQQEEQLQLAKFVLDNAPLNITYLDSKARIRYMNKTGSKTLGYTQEELLQMGIPDIDPLFPADVWDKHWQDLRYNKSIPVETVHRRKNGEEFPVEVLANYIEFGDKAYNVAFDRDISERKKNQVKILENEERLRLALDAANQAWFDLDIRSGKVRVSPEYARLIGFKPEEFHSSLQNWIDNIHPDDRHAVVTAFEICMKTPEPQTMEYRRRRKDGGWEWIKSIGKIVERDDQGAPLRMIGIHTDISEQKQSQSLLEAERQRFKMLFDSSSDGMFIIDMNGRFIDINRTAHDRLGYSKQEMMDMKLTELDPPEFAARVPERIALILKQGTATFETAHYRKDGSIMPVEINARIIELNGENVFFSVVRDISERKELEEQLRQSQKMEAVGTLVGGIAHDFNNMLAAIQGNLYLARKQLRDHPVADTKLGNIEKLGTRAAGMVHQLLTFARKDSVDMHVFSLNNFMREGYKLASAAIPENINHRSDLCTQELHIRGDATQLQQVLMNLLNNALDAVANTPNPQIHCSLSPFTADSAFINRHRELSQKHFACISVSDNGYGIDASHLDKIFEPFFTTKEVGKGTGLGLAMLYGAVQTHGGVVEVVSKADHGTTFKVLLPLCDDSAADDELRSEAASPSVGSGETILLVDDEPSVREVTGEVLASLGYRILEAANGSEALAMIQSGQPVDLVLSDVVMPVMGGVEFLNHLREAGCELPFILATGYDPDRVIVQKGSDKRCRILNKPFDFNHLSGYIQEMIAEQR